MTRSIKPMAWVLMGAGVLVLAAGAAAFRRAPSAPVAPPPAEVSVLTVAPETVAARYEYVGQAEASRSVEVRSQVTGVVVARPYAEGTDVAKGTLLFRIDPTTYEAAYRSAQARLANAERNLARLKSLLASRAVAQKDADDAQTAFDQAQAAVDQTKKDYDDTSVRAEIAGRVGRARLELGGRVTGPGDLLTTVEQVDPIYLNFSPSDQDILRWRRDAATGQLLMPPSMSVQVVLADGTVLSEPGKLNFVDLALQPETGTQQLRAVLPNPKHVLLPGQFVRVRLLGLKIPKAILVPQIRNVFIRRPIFSGVISIVIVLLGLFALRTLPVNSYPALTPPEIQVQAVYPGATAQDVAAAVAAPIEQQLSGLEGLLYFKSSNSSAGVMNLSVYFDVSRNPDLAAVDVQNQIALAEPQLPQEVVRNGITVQKRQTSILVVGALTADNPRFDAEYLSNYSKIYVQDELKRLPGVGDAQTVGQLEFSMLLSLDPDRMAQLGLTVSDVAGAVQEQNATNPAGRIGREPSPPGTQLTIPVVTAGRLTDPAQFGQIIVRGRPDGSLVRVNDIGEVRLGARNYDVVGRLDGKPTALFLVFLRPGANALQVKRAVLQRMGELAKGFPAGVRWSVPFDTTPYITASIYEVVKTLFEAMLLVTLVVFLFLQSWRATLIPVLAVPVSVIGAFFGMQALGFSINLLTLFGLVLAIGIVVDDAIVVIENVERIMASEGVSPAVAADRAMQQVSRALIAIVLVLCSVFVPVAFLGGITGLMYRQFAITIAIAVVLSGIVALTLTPALCAVLLKPSHPGLAPGVSTDPGRKSGLGLSRFFARFNRGFHAATERYLGAAGRVIDRPRTFFAAFGVVVALLFVLVRSLPSGFIPSEDKGYFAMLVALPDDASRQRTEAVVGGIEGFLKRQPAINHVVALVGLDFIQNANQTNAAIIFVNMKPWDERSSRRDQINAVLGAVNGYLFGMRNARGFAFNLPEIIGLGTTAGLEMNLQDRGVNDVQRFAALVNDFTREANGRPELRGVYSTLRVNTPQLYVQVDREKTKALVP